MARPTISASVVSASVTRLAQQDVAELARPGQSRFGNDVARLASVAFARDVHVIAIGIDGACPMSLAHAQSAAMTTPA